MNTTNHEAKTAIVKTAGCGSCLAHRGEHHHEWCQSETQRYLMTRLTRIHKEQKSR